MLTMLLSIKPEYAKSILEGKKKFEFRKIRCHKDVRRIILYATFPLKSVVGEAEIEEVLQDTPSEIWKVTRDKAGITKKFYDAYYKGKKKAVAYRLKNVKTYSTPRSLVDLGVEKVPRSYVYIDDAIIESEAAYGMD